VRQVLAQSDEERHTMRGSEVAVEVTLDSGETLPEVAKHGMRYVIARAGKPFRVKVTALGEAKNTINVRARHTQPVVAAFLCALAGRC
jgi:hypothetical protein